MSYIIHWSSLGLQSIPGKVSISLADKTYDNTTTSLTLTGKGLKDYGLIQQENFLRLLESFASNTSPAHPTIGQIWYNTAENNLYLYSGSSPNTVTINGWTLLVPAAQQGGGIAEYNLLANTLNKIIGAPTYTNGATSMATASTAYGWNQTDLVPTYLSVQSLTPASMAVQSSLPSGSVFPATFSNASWTILLSRLRKALRQTNVPEITEYDTAPVGFLSDGTGSTAYGNILNNFSAGPVPHQGQVADYTPGWGAYGMGGIYGFVAQTMHQINTLKQNPERFSLNPNTLISEVISSSSRTTPAKSLTIPSSLGTYKLTNTFQFGTVNNMLAYFNSGGQLKFDFSFTASAGVQSNIEKDWRRFLVLLSGLVFDYQGTKIAGQYVAPIEGHTETTTLGFYGVLAGLGNNILTRDVLSSLSPVSIGLYNDATPLDGGVIINASITGSQLVIDIDFYLQHVTGGSVYEADTVDTSLTGRLMVNTWSTYASNKNLNNPAIIQPSVAASGTFITAV